MNKNDYSIGDYILLIFTPLFSIFWFILCIQYCMIITLVRALIKFEMPKKVKITINLPHILKKDSKK